MIKNNFLAFDTSNYTTSAAGLICGELLHNKKLLPVKNGEVGIRQSDAVFHHVQQLPEVAQHILQKSYNIHAIGVSSRPRDLDGSYMPCFSVGYSFSKSLSDILHVPLYTFSHQAGHIAAALYSSNRLDLISKRFIAYHVSGGTTEAVLVSPDKETIIKEKIISCSLDLKAGQAVDRVGNMLGLSFPAGIELEKLAINSCTNRKAKPTMKGRNFCLSGLENQCQKLLDENACKEDIAKYCLDFIASTLKASCKSIITEFGEMPVVFAGGVMSNKLIRKQLENEFNAYFAEPEFARDNAVGILILTAIRDGEDLCS